MKKKHVLLFSILIIISSVSCEKIEELLTFSIDHSTQATIRGNSPIEVPIGILTPEITTNSEQHFKNNDTRKEYVKDIILNKLDVSINEPENQTFSFLKEVYIYISADSYEELQIAHSTDIPENAKSISLETTNKNLDNYVKSDEYKLRVEAVTREVIANDVIVDIDITFTVTANPA